jgi:putative transposase
MKYRRAFILGGSFFFTVVTEEWQLLFASAEAVAKLRTAFHVIRSTRPFNLEAVVALPDHLHCIWTLPPGDADFATLWWLIRAWFTQHGDLPWRT